MRLFCRKPKPASPPRPRGRRGLLSAEFVGAGLLNKGEQVHAVIEVEEVDRHNGLSHVRILQITGVPAHHRKDVQERIPEWFQSSQITWLDKTQEASA
jgi:hypothetical protein